MEKNVMIGEMIIASVFSFFHDDLFSIQSNEFLIAQPLKLVFFILPFLVLEMIIAKMIIATSLTLYQNDEILDWSKFKAFADDKLNVEKKKMKFGLGRVQNIFGKGKNVGNQHFLLVPQCFQKLSFP